ncbi:anaphase-promoting complex subunit 11 RING-H2 finger-domain-containing protein [Aspergillus carlsbadensis]|nr:anaphase-promoting complex subunit 11 RING-H2 finger-domain-containing protein [Aspergillus carlsbadensis]
MKVTLKEWNAVATWRWDMPDDEVCGICRVQFDGTCPTCKFPGDDCSLLLGKCGHSFHMLAPSIMSLPKPSPPLPLSSSPSKQSFRRPSRPHSIDQQLARTHDTPDEYPSQNHSPVPRAESHIADDEALAHHELPAPSHNQILSHPFFTLIEDAHTSEYYHPTVHYIFSDDDNDIVTEAALRSLESEQDTFLNTSAKGKSKAPGDNAHLSPPLEEPGGNYDEDIPRRKESLLPEPIPGVRENYIILDVDHTPVPQQGTKQTAAGSPDPQAQAQTATQGDAKQPREAEQPSLSQPHHFTITSAHSLSPSWQVLNTSIAPAPTFETNASAENPVNGGLMLQIRGTSGLPIGILGKDKERGSQRLEDMMDQFARRLDELRLVIENGEQDFPSRPEGLFEEPMPLGEPGEDEVNYTKEEGSAP